MGKLRELQTAKQQTTQPGFSKNKPAGVLAPCLLLPNCRESIQIAYDSKSRHQQLMGPEPHVHAPGLPAVLGRKHLALL